MHFLKKNKTTIVSLFLFVLVAGTLFLSLKGFASQAADQFTLPAKSIPKVSGGSWQETEGKYAYVYENETQAGGWIRVGKKIFYIGKDGYRVTGMVKIGSARYYFNKNGVRKTGWKSVNGKKYYFDPNKNGMRSVGWTKIGDASYYYKTNGKYRTGWFEKDEKTYYFQKDGKMVTGWQTIGGKRYYFNKKTGVRASGKVTIKKKAYYFSEAGELLSLTFDTDGYFVDKGGNKLQKNTIKNLLKVALQPVGSTVYVWGGGWNNSANATELADITARTIGVNPQWKTFYEQQTSAYNYQNTRYQSKNGLDCSGYVGWVLYNTFNTTSGNAGYVMLAQVMARTYAGYGWGSYTPAGSVQNFKAGDIMSTSAGHVYIVVGQCGDGSVVLLHSSPSGVMISGTATRSGNTSSQAVSLATSYMKKYYPGWYAKFPRLSRSASYLTSYSQMRWYIGTKNAMLSDPEGYLKKNASQILKDLFK